MKNAKYYSLLLVVVILFMMSGCKGEPLNDLSEDKLDEEISHWSSKEYEGRQTGTEANNRVRDEIVTQFNEMELEPIQTKDYLTQFEMDYYNPQKIQANLIVNLHNGKKKEFTYGQDWMEHLTNKDIHIEVPISFSDTAGTILVSDDLQSTTENVAAKFIKTDKFHKKLKYLDSGISSFQISDSFYTYLKTKEKEIKSVNLTYSAQSEKITAYNVAGKITGDGGKLGKQAIILSAHFDHIGTAGETIFLGSVDNATGLTGLMNLASILKEDSKEKAFASDILFVAFNAEESGLVGSKAFVDEISSHYQSIININMDTIGIKDGGKISFVGEELGSELLSEKLNKIATEKKIESSVHIEKVAGLISDHISFINANYQAINISQERFDKIHTVEDNMEYTDSKPLKSAIEIIRGFVHENHTTKFEMMDRKEISLPEEIDEHKNELNFAEYETFPSRATKKVEIAYNLTREMSKEEVSQIESSFMNESTNVKLLNAQFSYEPNNQKSLKARVESTNSIREVKKMKNSDYKLTTIYLTVNREDTDYYIQIFEGAIEELEKNHKEIDTIGSWNLIAGNESTSDEKTYSTAISTVNLDNRVFTVLIQNYDVNTNTQVDSYNKTEIEGLLTILRPELSSKVFLAEEAALDITSK
ncbi:M28 family metallopeptidase [Sporosarcina limicola]|uniref:Peptidase M28 domain-containing protein n=1 Tax=Sporosarcina limicola TaxID=34101 RepID=A0A927R3U2_9BACL|nr:M28 family peptidase [Sporosarcina limicola]MBE1555451.1 hypothetical protein [Sporosarcina limicola]